MTNKSQLIAPVPAQNTSTNAEGFENSLKNLKPDQQITSNNFTNERKQTMFGFQKTEFVRIFLVKESHCDKDMYVLKPFDDDSINEEMNPDEIYEEFSYLIEYVFNYCGGYFVIDDESTVDGDGNILLNDTEITGEKVEFIIPDIRDRIITKTDKPIYCVVFGYDPMEYTCTGYIWVVVEPTRTEYRG